MTSQTVQASASANFAQFSLRMRLDAAAFDRVLTILFVVLTCIPMVGMVVKPSSTIENWDDLRPISEAPQFPRTLDQWKRLPSQCETFFADRICFRNLLIRLQNLVGLRVFGSAPLGTTCLKPRHSAEGAVAGREGWLYCAGHGSLSASRCTDPFTERELNDWRQVHQQRQRWLQDRGIRYLFVLAPDKHTIYPEFVPPCMEHARRKTRFDQLYEHLKQFAPNVEIVDLRPALFHAKLSYPCYHRTDTHWNKLGALVATSAILQKVGERDSHRAHAPTFADFEITSSEGQGGDISHTLKLKHVYSELYFEATPRISPGWNTVPRPPEEPHAWTTVHPDASKPRVLFISDSFGWNMAPFFPEHCSRFTWYMQILKDEFPIDLIERESPDLVIFEHVERKLNYLAPCLANGIN